MLTFRRLLVGIFLFAFFASTNISAEQEHHFVIGVQAFADYAPYSTFKNGEYQGFNRELLDAFANEYSYEFEYRALPLKRLYHNLVSGEIDAKYPDNPSWTQDLKQGREVIYSDPVVSFIDGVIMLDENHDKSRKALATIGMISGFTPWPFLQDIKANTVTVYEANNMDALIKMLLTNRIDGIYTNAAVFRNRIKLAFESAPSMSLNTSLPFLAGTRHMSSVSRPDLVIQFNQFLENHASFVESLKQQYGLINASLLHSNTQNILEKQ
ncbi:substrate-binding periplasmic protein [Enterovibrio calviensis]|uniref:substrate-binding periplasmic protein n=1 Tax=Enterovibrio calviensis TaxID=91359 RepID=UPI003735EB7F